MYFDNSGKLCEFVAEQNNGTAILSFSGGKDSVASWLQMRRYFTKIVPFFYYMIPGLSFEEDAMKYYEDFFQTRIIRLPSPGLYKSLKYLLLQAPENCRAIEEADLPQFTYDELATIIREDCKLPDETLVATGVRARDSLNRWAAIKKYGPINLSRKAFYPIFDYNKAAVVKELYDSKVKLGYGYRLFGRTFDGLDYRFVNPVKIHKPKDYARILEFFPMAELETLRMQYRAEYYAQIEAAQKEVEA